LVFFFTLGRVEKTMLVMLIKTELERMMPHKREAKGATLFCCQSDDTATRKLHGVSLKKKCRDCRPVVLPPLYSFGNDLRR